MRKTVAAMDAAGGPFFFAAKKFESDAELVERRGQVPLRRLFT